MRISKPLTLAFVLVLTSTACAANRQVAVTVSVSTSQGQPVPDAPVVIRGYGDIGLAMTDQDGRAVFGIDAIESDAHTAVCVLGVFTGRSDLVSPELIAHSEQRHSALVTQFAVPDSASTVMSPNVDGYALTLVLADPVTVTGRLVDSAGQPVLALIGVPGFIAQVVAGPDQEQGSFVLPGVPKGRSTDLVILPNSPFVHYRHLSAAQTLDDVAIGDIVLPTQSDAGRININVTNRGLLTDRDGILLDRHAALISADGEYALNYYVTENDQAGYEEAFPTQPLKVPPGTYYAAPAFWAHDTHIALRNSLLAGRHAALEAAGVPKIVVPDDGTTVTLNVDARAARDAILQVGADLLED